MSAGAKIVDRLDKAREVGPGRWLACCPAHQDRSPSLSIREADDGRVLLHCFAGCNTEDVVSALGLTLTDLFEASHDHRSAQTHSRIPAADLLVILDHELTVTVLILDDVVSRRTVNESQIQRLCQAAARIGKARDMAKPAKVNRHAA
jgi:hypothetical protein